MNLDLNPILVNLDKVQTTVHNAGEQIEDTALNTTVISDGVDWKNFFAQLFKGKKILQQKKILAQLEEFDKAEDSEEKNRKKMTILQTYKEIVKDNLPSLNDENCSVYTRLLLRFGALNGGWLKDRHIERLNELKIDHTEQIEDVEFPVFYVDEWLKLVQDEKIRPSAIEDARSSFKKKSPNEKLNQFYKSMETEIRNLDTNIGKREMLFSEFQEICEEVYSTALQPGILEDGPPYDLKISNTNNFEKLRKAMSKMQAIDRFLNGTFMKVDKIHKEAEALERKLGADAKPEEVKKDLLSEEFEAILQMAKMCVGPRGNDFPVLHSQFLGQDIITREVFLKHMREFKRLDSDMFYWKFQGLERHDCPWIILVPCYGETGACWEPIDFANKASGRGKIAIPMFPSNNPVEKVILNALSQYRWLKEKELLSTYWMNEGITGNYYMYHEGLKKAKRKGTCEIKFDPDLKKNFVADYILWMMFEAKGMQKLSKECRGIFYNHMPFPDDLKEQLKDRGYVYKVLWENDQRKKKSRGY